MGTPSRQRSRRGALIAAVCLLLTAGVGFQWWRSQAHFDSFRWRGLVVMTAQGKICLLHTDAAPDGPDRTGLHSVPYTVTEKKSTIIQWPTWGFTSTTDPARGEKKLTVVAPLWFVACLSAAPVVWWRLRGRQEARLADEMD